MHFPLLTMNKRLSRWRFSSYPEIEHRMILGDELRKLRVFLRIDEKQVLKDLRMPIGILHGIELGKKSLGIDWYLLLFRYYNASITLNYESGIQRNVSLGESAI